jgi:hypothetical protein
VTAWLDPDRACRCHLCQPNHADDGCLDWRDGTAGLVTEHGWSVVGIGSEDDVPAWAFTVGLWHTLGSPEVAMFGLRLPDMQRWLNQLGGQIRDGQPLAADERRDGVLDGFPLAIRPVHPSWYPRVFGSAVNFYQRPPLPIVQAIWPDRTGLFPWQDGSGDNCRANQPWLWLPYDDHPPSIWADLDAVTPWPFTGLGARTPAYTLRRIAAAGGQVRGVVHDHGGTWQFLDGGPITKADVTTAHLHHLLARHPHIREVADLRPGEQAWLDAHDTWHRSPLPPDTTGDQPD